MLNWGAVDRILWMGVLCLVTWCAVSTTSLDTHNILSTAPQLSISQKAQGTLPEDGNVMPKYDIDISMHLLVLYLSYENAWSKLQKKGGFNLCFINFANCFVW